VPTATAYEAVGQAGLSAPACPRRPAAAAAPC